MPVIIELSTKTIRKNIMIARMNYWAALNHIQTNIKSCRTQEHKNVVRKMITNTYDHFNIDEHKRTYKGGKFESSQFDGWLPEYLTTLDMWHAQKVTEQTRVVTHRKLKTNLKQVK